MSEFAVAPRIVARRDLALWHSVGTALYAAQWLCSLVVIAKVIPAQAGIQEAPADSRRRGNDD